VVVQLQQFFSILIHHPVSGHEVADASFLTARDTPPGQQGQYVVRHPPGVWILFAASGFTTK